MNIKQLLLLIFFAMVSISAAERSPKIYQIIAFDLHDTLLSKRQNQAWAMISQINPLSIQSWKAFGRIAYVGKANKGKTSDQVRALIDEQYEGYDCKDEMHAMLDKVSIDNYTVTPGILEIINELQQQGLELHVVSACGDKVYEKFKQHPEFKDLLEKFIIHHVIDYSASNIAEKETSAYFEKYLTDKKLTERSNTIFFTDDKQKNIDAAQKAGIDGIRFVSAEQLRQELTKRNILK